MGQKAQWEYLRGIYERYRQADRKGKHALLNEFCVNTGYYRKYAIRLLNGPPPDKAARGASRTRRRGLSYSRKVLSISAAVWEAAEFPLSHSHDSGAPSPSVISQMARQPRLRLHS